ncbi:hypothetical protein Sden_3640 [Shewanella denitrificans OS217]|uniref:Uncharacterized protein n=1 Tax=Shewanella denitrificans (strain OS217 / ATCC BAA-1090 / DSM 15013) TaxID=318161 RepID=Q12I11_SHEDO|nr:hypothetical protein [Shewanella denitrificans]ABE56915.1 hypothetical protein Sden_3640 [Shewanella denitrificans OS217]
MIKGVGESLNVMRQSQSLAPAAAATGGVSSQFDTPAQHAIPKHRLDSYQRWAKATAEQHSISASQVTLQALTQAKQLLQQLAKLLQSAVQDELQARQNEKLWDTAETLRQQLLGLKPQYQGIQLLDHHFNLLSTPANAAMHAFVFKSVDLCAPKDRDEKITIQLGKKTVVLTLAAGLSRQQLLQQMAPIFERLGISLELVADELVCKTHSAVWQLVCEGVLMMGEGQRLPAGELRQIRIEARYHWQDPREWGLSAIEQARPTLAKIAKTQQKIAQQANEINTIHQVLLARINANSQAKDTQVALNYLDKYMRPQPFSYQVTSLMAQSNTNRDQVGALLG